jgi:hypothetical protein
MTRRSSIAAPLSLLAMVALAQVPNPPTDFRVDGSQPVADPYTTTFPLTENPISEGGIWTLGGTTGRDWQDMRSSGGIAYGVGPSDQTYNDNLAFLQGHFSSNRHFAEGTVHKEAYSPPSTHEILLHVGGTVGPNSLPSYEMLWNYGGSTQFVRYDGPSGQFQFSGFTTLVGGAFSVSHGDVVRAEFDSTSGSPVINMYRNNVLMWSVTDTTAGKIMNGNPGIGAFFRSGAGLDATKYAWAAFRAGSL